MRDFFSFYLEIEEYGEAQAAEDREAEKYDIDKDWALLEKLEQEDDDDE